MVKMGETENTNKINMIGIGTTIEGSISSSENIRFDGNLIGNLNTKGKVFIGQSGKVTGEIRCKNCESGRGCARGIATTDPELTQLIEVDWATQRLINLFSAWCIQLIEILHRLGMRDIRELVGRTDCLRHIDYEAT